jgi:hypothetical protein
MENILDLIYRRTFLKTATLAGCATLIGCQPTVPPTTQPAVPNADAQNTLNAIMTTEAVAMAAIQVACGANLLNAADCSAATVANTAFLAVAASVQASITSGTPLTASEVGNILAVSLQAVIVIHASTRAAKTANAKTLAKISK